MDQYFIYEDNRQLGPFDLEQLQLKRLKEDTRVWYKGLSNWKKACEIDELKILFISKGIQFFTTDFNFPPTIFGYKVNRRSPGSTSIAKAVISIGIVVALMTWLIYR